MLKGILPFLITAFITLIVEHVDISVCKARRVLITILKWDILTLNAGLTETKTPLYLRR